MRACEAASLVFCREQAHRGSIADGFYNVDVLSFVAASHVVALPYFSLGPDEPKGFGMVIDIEPIPYLVSFAIDGELLVVEGIQDDEGDEFLREMVWAIVV